MGTAAQERFLRFGAVADMIGLSRRTIWKMEQEGRFPKRVQLGKKESTGIDNQALY